MLDQKPTTQVCQRPLSKPSSYRQKNAGSANEAPFSDADHPLADNNELFARCWPSPEATLFSEPNLVESCLYPHLEKRRPLLRFSWPPGRIMKHPGTIRRQMDRLHHTSVRPRRPRRGNSSTSQLILSVPQGPSTSPKHMERGIMR